jgi:beta-carotene/zeaxanthin 4-ketolase
LIDSGITLLEAAQTETAKIVSSKYQEPSSHLGLSEPQELSSHSAFDSSSTLRGGWIAGTIILIWAMSFSLFLRLDVTQFPAWLVALAALWQTLLYTGLFITAHDAMHGSVCPQNPKLNQAIGSFCTFSYGLFSYKELLRKHQLHHRYPASDRDPDFHDGIHKHPVAWYLYFMVQYWRWQRAFGLASVFILANLGLHISVSNLLIFWVVPSLLSSIQLFYFGTFLTHREPHTGYSTPQRAQSTSLPIFWSLVTCYHFGYHHEHHEFPHLPWWRLPTAHKIQRFHG